MLSPSLGKNPLVPRVWTEGQARGLQRIGTRQRKGPAGTLCFFVGYILGPRRGREGGAQAHATQCPVFPNWEGRKIKKMLKVT